MTITDTPQTNQETEAVEYEAVKAPEPTKAKRGRPSYGVKAVGELPPQRTPQARDLASIYSPLLADVAANADAGWCEMVRFTTLTGARSALRQVAEAIQNGEIIVDVGRFEFDSRRRVYGTKDSVLYGRYIAD